MPKDIIIPVEVGGVKFKNPFFVASGPTTKSVQQLIRIERAGWAAASIKLTIDPAPYINRVPRYAVFNDRNALAFTAEKRLNFEQGLRLVEKSKKRLTDLILFANITYAGDKGIEGWVNMAKRFEEAGADIIELNMCCPNMSYNMELTSGDSCVSNVKTGASLGQQGDAIAEIVREIKKTIDIPLFVKLTPEGGHIADIAKAIYAAGADAVGGTGNRLAIPPIDLEHPERAAYHLQDEISMSCHCGSWLKPLALRDTYEIRKVNGPEARIMAAGGITNYKDAIEMIMCGADLVGVCAETLIRGYDFIEDEIQNLKRWMDDHEYKDLREMRDLVVPEVKTAPELTLYKGYAEIKEPNLQAPCKSACPMHVPAQAYVRKVAKKKYKEAFDLITGAAPLQSICGFICNHPCEDECTRGEYGNPVRIRDIKRFALEYGKNQGWKAQLKLKDNNNKKVAVIGSGPASISNAYYLAKSGYQVTMFEQYKELGGSLRYGTPSFRLPRGVIGDEIETLKAMGVEIKTNCKLDRDITIDSLKKDGFKTIFIGEGFDVGKELNIPGENSKGIIDATSLLYKVNCGEKIAVGEKVIVLGENSEAIDSARAVKRLGAKKVYVASAIAKDKLTGLLESIQQAEAEGIHFVYGVSYKEIESANDHVSKVVFYNDIPEVDECTTFVLKCNTVIKAVGTKLEDINGIQMENGVIKVDELSLETNIAGVYAGGDAIGVSDPITAVASGRTAAASMDRYIFGDQAEIEYIATAPVVDKEIILKRTGFFKDAEGVNLETASGVQRVADFEMHTRTMTEDEVVSEASRCLSCGCGEGCGICMSICSEFCIYAQKPDVIKIGSKGCVACGMCYNMCPLDNIEMISTGEKA